MAFSFSGWLKNMRSSLLGTPRNKRRWAVGTMRRKRLNLEQLEDRVTPAGPLATASLIEAPTIGIATDAVTTTAPGRPSPTLRGCTRRPAIAAAPATAPRSSPSTPTPVPRASAP